MKILLIRPKPHRDTIGLQNVMICEPLELEYIAAYLKTMSHQVIIVDMILEKQPVDHFINLYQPDVVGITAYIAHVNVIKTYAATIKATNPQVRVIVGGVHAEVVPTDFCDTNIDHIICANGLKTFGQLLDAMQNAQPTATIDGCYQPGKQHYKKDDHFDYPHPDRQLVARYRHAYYYMFHNPCALIKTSFGCPFQCSFCFCRQITDGQYYTRSLDDIISELLSIPQREIYIVDDDFLIDRQRILDFCKRLADAKIDKRFLIYARADFIAQNQDVIAAFAAVGLRAVIVGLESSSEQELIKYNKNSNVKNNERAIAILRQYGVECYGTLILGVNWDRTDFKRLYRWLKAMKLRFINLQPFTPLPGTPLFAQYQEQLIVKRQDYQKWDLAHLVVKPTKLSIRAYYFEIVKLYYKITMHPKTVLTLINDYGLWQNIKLSLGASRITWQYLSKIIKG